MKYLIGIDLGTSATKTVLFDAEGNPLASDWQGYPLYQPQNGWAEQEPDHWWQACTKSLANVMAKAGINKNQVAGIGLSGQMHGLVMLDAGGEVLRSSIIWCDGRTGKECSEITQKVGRQRLIEITANPALPGFTASKILWVKNNQPDIYAKCRHILLPKDYLRFKLCGVFASDVSDASGTNLFDVPQRKWSEEVLLKLGIEKALLPAVVESAEVCGHITDAAAAQTGLAPGTPVVGGAADNAAAAVGTGVVTQGRAFTTIGTSGVIFAHSKHVAIDPKGRVHTFCSAVPGAYAVMSCTLAAGGSLQWFRNQFCTAEEEAAKGLLQDVYQLLDKQAEKVPQGASRLLFLPYLMGERSPVLNADARAVFFGLSAVHTKQHMLRAVMEGVIFSLRHCLDVLKEMGLPFEKMLATGGGGTSPFWRQMMADIYNCPVVTIENKEGPALGAAILAGVGAGVYQSVESACESIVKTGTPKPPNADDNLEYEKYYALYKAIYESTKEHFETLAKL